MHKGDSITILSDQPLSEAAATINGYNPNNFFANQVEQQRIKTAAQGLNNVVVSTACTVAATNLFNAKAEPCAVAQR